MPPTIAPTGVCRSVDVAPLRDSTCVDVVDEIVGGSVCVVEKEAELVSVVDCIDESLLSVLDKVDELCVEVPLSPIAPSDCIICSSIRAKQNGELRLATSTRTSRVWFCGTGLDAGFTSHTFHRLATS